jgi:hypothetical protein
MLSVGTVTFVTTWTFPAPGISASSSVSVPVQLSVPGAAPGQILTTSTF